MPREEMEALSAVSAQEDQSCLQLIEVQAVSAKARHLVTWGAGCSRSVVQHGACCDVPEAQMRSASEAYWCRKLAGAICNKHLVTRLSRCSAETAAGAAMPACDLWKGLHVGLLAASSEKLLRCHAADLPFWAPCPAEC